MWIYVKLDLMLYSSHCSWLAISQNSRLAGARSWYWTVNMGIRIEIHLGADENQFGDINTLALDIIINPSDESDEEMTLMIPFQYYTVDNLPVKMIRSVNLNVISLNAKSINAKFYSLLILLEMLVNKISPSMSYVCKKAGYYCYFFVTVKDIDIGKEIVVWNIYRPPYDNNNG